MPLRVAQTGRLPLEAYYRTSAGALADPVGPLVAIIGPTGAVHTAGVVPTRRSLGVYEYPAGGWLAPAEAPLGIYAARWTGAVEGAEVGPVDETFEVVVAGSLTAGTYGATVADVEALLPHRTFTAATATTPADLDRWLVDVGARVAVRLEAGLAQLRAAGAPLAVRVTALEELAAACVALGAAAYAEDAGYPERSGVDATDSSYAAVLWLRHGAMLDELAGAVDEEVDNLGRAGAAIVASFPTDNLFSRSMRW